MIENDLILRKNETPQTPNLSLGTLSNSPPPKSAHNNTTFLLGGWEWLRWATAVLRKSFTLKWVVSDNAWLRQRYGAATGVRF